MNGYFEGDLRIATKPLCVDFFIRTVSLDGL